jgi:hypothetical protein
VVNLTSFQQPSQAGLLYRLWLIATFTHKLNYTVIIGLSDNLSHKHLVPSRDEALEDRVRNLSKAEVTISTISSYTRRSFSGINGQLDRWLFPLSLSRRLRG